jgi:hypothetical protein
MRNSSTKERTRERREFVYLYRNEIEKLEANGTNPDRVSFVDNVVRKTLPYSCKTNSYDIFVSLFRTLKLIGK